MSKKSGKKVKYIIRPIGDGDSIIIKETNGHEEILRDTPFFEDYGEAEAYCFEMGYTPFEWG